MTHKSPDNKQKCYISERTDYFSKDEVRLEVCQDLPVEYEHEGKYYCLLHYPSIHKGADFNKEFENRLAVENYKFFGVFFPHQINLIERQFDKYVDFFDATFLGRVSFSGSVFKEGATFSGAIFEDYSNFSKVQFIKETTFTEGIFKGVADFKESVFQDVSFEHTEFQESAYFNWINCLNGINFNNSRFLAKAEFENTIFRDYIDFENVKFSERVLFRNTLFKDSLFFDNSTFESKSQVSFIESKFEGRVSFQSTVIEGYVAFERKPNNRLFVTNCSFLNFQNAHIEKPERISFHSVRLQPNWFINIDCRKFIFTSCSWRKADGEKLATKSELEALDSRKISSIYSLFTKTCWQLADNYEETKGFNKASDFRLMANESKRLAARKGYKFWNLHWWYWLTSSYGESWERALGILSGILFVFAFIYILMPFQICPMDKPLALSIQQNLCETRILNFEEAILQSLATATFQNIEYQKPLTLAGEITRILEKIFAPLQAALLALAIRRKFMR